MEGEIYKRKKKITIVSWNESNCKIERAKQI